MKLLLLALALLTTLAAQTSVRTNVGGPTYTDSLTAVWQADTGCTTSTLISSGNTINGTSDPTLYRTGRQANSFSCTYTVTGLAFYNVALRFAETNAAITVNNPRIFNVFINNVFQRTINIAGSGAAHNVANDYTFGPIAVYGTEISVLFVSVSNMAFINAIDIEATGGGGGSAGVCGADTEVQFNDALACGHSSDLTYNKTTHVLSATGGYASGNGTDPGLDHDLCGTAPATPATGFVDGYCNTKVPLWKNEDGKIFGTIFAGTKALATSAISSGACTSAQTTAATGVLTTDVIEATFSADPSGVTGYAPTTGGMLTLLIYPTANTINVKVCNNTSSSITPGAVTLNLRVSR